MVRGDPPARRPTRPASEAQSLHSRGALELHERRHAPAYRRMASGDNRPEPPYQASNRGPLSLLNATPTREALVCGQRVLSTSKLWLSRFQQPLPNEVGHRRGTLRHTAQFGGKRQTSLFELSDKLCRSAHFQTDYAFFRCQTMVWVAHPALQGCSSTALGLIPLRFAASTASVGFCPPSLAALHPVLGITPGIRLL
jgi:hypothetical protein